MSTTFNATSPPRIVYPPHRYSTTSRITSLAFPRQNSNIPSLSLTNSNRRSSSCVTFSINASAANGEGNAKFSGSGGCGGGRSNSGGGSAGYCGGGVGNDWDNDMNERKNGEEALVALAEAGRSLECLPEDFKAAAVVEGGIRGSDMQMYLHLQKSISYSWLMKSGGFKQSLLAEYPFLAQVAVEFCGVGVQFIKTVTAYESLRENLFEDLEIVIADEVISLTTDVANASLNAHMVDDDPVEYGSENVPIQSTSVVYGAYTAIFSNFRHQFEQWFPAKPKLFLGATICFAEGTGPGPSSYQVLSGKMEHHLLEPLRRQREQYFSLVSLTVGSGNLFFGSLVWGILSLIV